MNTPDDARRRATMSPGLLVGAETSVLAAALAHLLARDEDLPARWRTASFADGVEAARADLVAIGSIPSLPVTGPGADERTDFGAAVARLARNPGDVAVAVRRIELAGCARLPAWPALLRRGLPARPSDLDALLWFG